MKQTYLFALILVLLGTEALALRAHMRQATDETTPPAEGGATPSEGGATPSEGGATPSEGGAAASMLTPINADALKGQTQSMNISTEPGAMNAVCILAASAGNNITGLLSMAEIRQGEPLNMTVDIRGLNANSPYAIEFHEYGDLTNGCESLGPMFSGAGGAAPSGEAGAAGANATEGGAAAGGEAGATPEGGAAAGGAFDLTNLMAAANNSIWQSGSVSQFSLSGDNSLFGRGCAVRMGGAQETPSFLACGVIGRAQNFTTLMPSSGASAPSA